MARGKIQIRKIENPTNRQVTYSKRRGGLFKKAKELTVLCDAKVSIVIFSSTNKVQEYISPSVTMKQMYDQYQRVKEVDVWSSLYEEMQETLRKSTELNNRLRRDIRQRMGASLNDLSFGELIELDHEIESSLTVVRERKFKQLSNQVETSKKKGKGAGDMHRQLVHHFVTMDARDEDPQYGLIENGGEYENVVAVHENGGGSSLYALHMQNNNHQHHNLHSGEGSGLTTFALLD